MLYGAGRACSRHRYRAYNRHRKLTGRFKSIDPDGDASESSTVMTLKQNGTEITGTVGLNENNQHMV